ncbi:hypothetical protein BSKO_03370 [Bryopsis sp. KO-2023]|nr:hypothetical protein BSKO_03370 [Bryopsis sp. KO-2023]
MMESTDAGETPTVRPLFGGAIEVSVPQRFIDVSDFRPVPDHQEIFADGNTDQSIIVEIVQHVGDVPDAESARYFWNDLAEQNQSQNNTVFSDQELSSTDVAGIPTESFKAVIVGSQEVSKGRQGPDAANLVQISLAVLRLPSVGSDVLVTINTPIIINKNSTAAKDAGSGLKPDHVVGPSLLKAALGTLKVKEWGLFG